MRRGRRAIESEKKCREVVALLDLLKRSFACSVRWLSGDAATSTIDLAARNRRGHGRHREEREALCPIRPFSEAWRDRYSARHIS
jgi:hypothetical protein